jgi:oxygen-independent coproporphyrinogen-3 oxidase
MHSDLIRVDPGLLAKWNRPVPRYTSYPTAPQFHPVEEAFVRSRLNAFDQGQKTLSIYIHIPFCKSMCLFCGCSVILNRKPERQAAYLNVLLKEIDLTAGCFTGRRKVSQLHLGGGTPTSLSEEEFDVLMQRLRDRFIWERDAEISIEIDPRTVYADGGNKLAALKRLGFNRVSFGVQDLDPAVQEAVKRRQTEEMTVATYWKARELGFQGINIDLIYGLPLQTTQTFSKTVDRLLELKPDRIAFYSYAKVPWLKEHQKAIPEALLPSTEEKFRIYVEARARFMEGGYAAIGMDHFALNSDSIAKAYREKKLQRNFQGYSLQLADDMLGFGVTSIGFFEQCYLQNVKELQLYHDLIAQDSLPVLRGFVLSEEDLRRRWVVQSLMCHFELEKQEFFHRFGLEFDAHFAQEKKGLIPLIEEGFLIETNEKLEPTPLGRLFIRLIAASFDAYADRGKFSRAV